MPTVHFILEAFLIGLILIIWHTRKIHPRGNKLSLSKQEEESIIKEWMPDPLVPDSIHQKSNKYPIVNGMLKSYTEIDQKLKLNLATMNFLDFIGNKDIENSAISCISKYAVGTCGPRGFYGTTDVHLLLENRLSTFFGVEECIVYSYGLTTFSSAIPAYCKKQDIIFADESVCYATQIGIQSSRSKIYWFKHNDLDDLERYLKIVENTQKQSPKKFKNVRKFIIIESLYINFGDIVDLKRLIQLKYLYKVRIFLDESLSVGILGESGRGITEHLGVDINDIDLISFSFETAFSSIGGACIGSSYVIDHQRLSGLGYCFSASSPTFLCQVVVDELDIIQNNPERINKLQTVSNNFYKQLSSRLHPRFHLDNCNLSPIIHIRFNDIPTTHEGYEYQNNIVDNIINKCFENDILLVNPSYIYEKELRCPPPSIRVSLNCNLTSCEISKSVDIICNSINEIVDSF